MQVQLVLHPGEPLSPNDQGESLPTTVHVFQLASADPIGKVSLDDLLADPAAALGEDFVDEQRLVLWPGDDQTQQLQPGGDAKHLLLVAEFRRLLGTSWYETYDIPAQAEHEAAYCTREKKRRKEPKRPPLADPCFFVTLEGYSVFGSPSSAGFEGIRPECAPPSWLYEIDTKERRRAERRERRRRRGGGLLRRAPRPPSDARPSAPRGPGAASKASKASKAAQAGRGGR